MSLGRRARDGLATLLLLAEGLVGIDARRGVDAAPLEQGEPELRIAVEAGHGVVLGAVRTHRGLAHLLFDRGRTDLRLAPAPVGLALGVNSVRIWLGPVVAEVAVDAEIGAVLGAQGPRRGGAVQAGAGVADALLAAFHCPIHHAIPLVTLLAHQQPLCGANRILLVSAGLSVLALAQVLHAVPVLLQGVAFDAGPTVLAVIVRAVCIRNGVAVVAPALVGHALAEVKVKVRLAFLADVAQMGRARSPDRNCAVLAFATILYALASFEVVASGALLANFQIVIDAGGTNCRFTMIACALVLRALPR